MVLWSDKAEFVAEYAGSASGIVASPYITKNENQPYRRERQNVLNDEQKIQPLGETK
jgi:hypothetical protein